MINQTCRDWVYDILEIPNDQPILDEVKFVLNDIKHDMGIKIEQ